jgi:hypothetical protein
LVAANGTRIPLNRTVFQAFKKFMDNKLTGQIVLHMKAGGIAAVEDRTMYQDSNQ